MFRLTFIYRILYYVYDIDMGQQVVIYLVNHWVFSYLVKCEYISFSKPFIILYGTFPPMALFLNWETKIRDRLQLRNHNLICECSCLSIQNIVNKSQSRIRLDDKRLHEGQGPDPRSESYKLFLRERNAPILTTTKSTLINFSKRKQNYTNLNAGTY